MRTMSYGASVLVMGPPIERLRSLLVAPSVGSTATLAHGIQVGEQRHVGQDQALVGEQAGGHQRQAGVFGAADVDAAVQRAATLDQYAVHAGVLGKRAATRLGG